MNFRGVSLGGVADLSVSDFFVGGQHQMKSLTWQALFCVVLLGGCQQNAPPADSAHDSVVSRAAGNPRAQVVSDLEIYGAAVEERANSDLKFARVDASDPEAVLSLYYVFFTSSQDKYQLEDVREIGDAMDKLNSVKRAAWNDEFCTPQLQQIMREHQIDYVYGTFGSPEMIDGPCRRQQ